MRYRHATAAERGHPVPGIRAGQSLRVRPKRCPCCRRYVKRTPRWERRYTWRHDWQ